jgi:ComF family protein
MSHRQRLWPPRWPLRLVRGLSASLLPSSCALCGLGSDAAVCAPCHTRFLGANGARCRCCANPLALRDACWPCAVCQRAAPAYDATVAAGDYASPLDQLVLQLKFGGRLALAPWMGMVLGQAVLARRLTALPDLLCPVPLGPSRLVERGFNQALEIARPLSRTLGIPLRTGLALRTRDTAAQSGVGPAERKRNIRRAFTLAPGAQEMVRGRHIGVVDDVMTSGATLHELAATLKRAGAARVSNFVFARTPPRTD